MGLPYSYFRELLADNYSSSNTKHFQPYQGSYGTDNFPNSHVHMIKSGFVRDVPRTLPLQQQVRTVCYDPRHATKAKTCSFLYHLQNKDPIERENNYYGPSFMSTENHTHFIGEPSQRMDTSTKTVGRKEGSGFVHAYNNEPITYRPNECFDGAYPGWCTWRPTSRSVMKKAFKPSQNSNGTESFKLLSKRAERDTGYTREIKPRPEYTVNPLAAYTKLSDVHSLTEQNVKKNDPAEYFNMFHATQHPSMTKSTFRGLQRKETSLTENSRKVSIGKNEETGYTENNCKFVETPETHDSLKRFDTHYQLRFYDKNSKLNAASTKYVMGQSSNGFTKSTSVQKYGTSVDTMKQFRELHPYVARSNAVRDPYYNIQDPRRRVSIEGKQNILNLKYTC